MRLSILLVTCGLLVKAVAQETIPSTPKPSVSDASHLGIGGGLDHGGLGLRVDLPINRHVAFVAGLGYAIVGPGWNAGLQYRFMPDSKVGLYATALYGYNGVIKVEGASQYDGIYYGPSAGAGVEFRQANSTNFFRMAVLVPFRSSEFYDDWDALKNNKAIEVKQGPLPIAISLGYHFAL